MRDEIHREAQYRLLDGCAGFECLAKTPLLWVRERMRLQPAPQRNGRATEKTGKTISCTIVASETGRESARNYRRTLLRPGRPFFAFKTDQRIVPVRALNLAERERERDGAPLLPMRGSFADKEQIRPDRDSILQQQTDHGFHGIGGTGGPSLHRVFHGHFGSGAQSRLKVREIGLHYGTHLLRLTVSKSARVTL